MHTPRSHALTGKEYKAAKRRKTARRVLSTIAMTTKTLAKLTGALLTIALALTAGVLWLVALTPIK